MLLGAVGGLYIDHRNGNGLDNRRDNLRRATMSQNIANQFPRGGSSKYKGVCRSKRSGGWLAQICVNRKSIYLGRFGTEEEAARAYDVKAKEVWGEFARLNFMDG